MLEDPTVKKWDLALVVQSDYQLCLQASCGAVAAQQLSISYQYYQYLIRFVTFSSEPVPIPILPQSV